MTDRAVRLGSQVMVSGPNPSSLPVAILPDVELRPPLALNRRYHLQVWWTASTVRWKIVPDPVREEPHRSKMHAAYHRRHRR